MHGTFHCTLYCTICWVAEFAPGVDVFAKRVASSRGNLQQPHPHRGRVAQPKSNSWQRCTARLLVFPMPCFICGTRLQIPHWHEVPVLPIQSFTWDEMHKLHWDTRDGKWYFCICDTCCEQHAVIDPVEWLIAYPGIHTT